MQGIDPIAQSFRIEGDGYGIFITKIDLYFKTKSSSRPITLQIREMVNGFPGPRIVPFSSCTLFPDEINLSEDASKPSVFVFPSPVYLKEGGEYCFVLIPAGHDPDYNIWVSELGQNSVGSTNRVSNQPSVGVLFTTSNGSTWTPVQSQDIKFTMYRANFETNSTGTIIINNRNIDYLTVTTASGNTIRSGVHCTTSSSSGYPLFRYELYNQISFQKTSNGIIKGNVTGSGNVTCYTNNANIFGSGSLFNTELYSNAAIYSANTNTRIGRIKTIVNDNEAILETNATENTSAGLYVIYDEIISVNQPNNIMKIETVDSKYVTLFDTNFSFLSFFPNEYTWQYKIRDDSTDSVGDYATFLVNEKTEVPSLARIDSKSVESTNYSNTKSLVFKADLSTTNSTVSPAYDTIKQSVIIVKNIINNDSSGETTNNGNALSKYISKLVVLDKDQDAEDMKVFLTAFKPAGTDIEVYLKPINANDPTLLYEANYIKLEKTTSEIVVSESNDTFDFKEYEFVVPSSSLTGPNGELQYTQGGNKYTGFKSFAIKIVLLSADSAVVPMVKDYRAIALQI